MTADAILSVQNVSKTFGGIKAVDAVSFEVQRGSITGLIGQNGSGKSTLFNLISGVQKKDPGGSVTFDGKRIDRLAPHKIFAMGLGRTFQTPRLFTGMTVLENTMVGAKGQKGESPLVAPFRSRWEHQEMDFAKKAKGQMEQLEIAGLYEKWSNQISGGQMKLVQLSNAIMGDPKMLLLDEPTAGVAPRLAQDIFQSIATERKSKGTTFFVIEHRLAVLFKHVDNVLFMHQGKIVAQGPPDQIVKDERLVDAYLGR